MSDDTKRLGSEPAFPHVKVLAGPPPHMTLRQWYAGLAMQGLLANSALASLSTKEMTDAALFRADALLAAEREG